MSSFPVCVNSSLILLMMSAVSFPAMSYAEDETLDSWMTKSRKLVNDNMTYPTLAIRYHKEGVSYVRVTIDKGGKILKYEITGKSGNNMLDRASLRTVRKIDEFPNIPIAMTDNEMTFGVRLRYGIAYSASELRKKNRKTNVRMQEMRKAENQSPLSADIVILATAK